jgi:hypothetical protein
MWRSDLQNAGKSAHLPGKPAHIAFYLNVTINSPVTLKLDSQFN